MRLLTVEHVTLTPADLDTRFYRRMFFFILASTIAYCFCLTFYNIPKDNQPYAHTILGFLLGTGFASLVGWRWGTAKSSEDKNKTIDQQIQNAADVAQCLPSPKLPPVPPVVDPIPITDTPLVEK
jgi:hypothetical protein